MNKLKLAESYYNKIKKFADLPSCPPEVKLQIEQLGKEIELKKLEKEKNFE